MSRRHGYLLVLGTARDRAGMDEYQSHLPPIYAAHKGYRLVMGGQTGGVTFLDGGLENLSMMLARFPTPEGVSEFWWSDAYREAYVHRKDAGRFSAIALPGLDRQPDPIPGDRGFLVVLSNPASPGKWRRFADPFMSALTDHGATILADTGPEAIERLESLMPGSHIIMAMFESEKAAKDAWSAVAPDLKEQREACGTINVIALAGLPDDHPWRLTQEVVAA